MSQPSAFVPWWSPKAPRRPGRHTTPTEAQSAGAELTASKVAATARTSPDEQHALVRTGAAMSSFWGSLVMVDFLFGIGTVFVVAMLTASLPAGLLLGAFMVLVALTRQATVQLRYGHLLVLLSVVLVAFLVLESRYNLMPWRQRTAKIVILLAVAAVFAQGRINIRSFIIGGTVGAVLNVGAYYGGLASDNYPPYLTGFYGDKNVAGMYYAIWGVLALSVLPKRWRRWWIAASFLFVFLTGSRTALFGLALAVGWYLLRNRVDLLGRLILAAAGCAALIIAVDRFAELSIFGNRQGTDFWRAMIDKATELKASNTPWFGRGLNQGYVLVGGERQAWVHDSFTGLFLEGGYPFLWLTVGVFVVVGLGLFDVRRTVPRGLLAAEAATIVVLVCAWKLGEVFITFGAAMVLGVVMAYRLGSPVDAGTRRVWEHLSQRGKRDESPNAWSGTSPYV